MKTFQTGFLGLILVLSQCAVPGGAQQQPPPPVPPPTTPPTAPPAPPDQDQPAGQPQINIRQPPPPLPKVPDVRQPGETGLWVGVSGWFPTENPVFDKGHAAAFTTGSRTIMQGKPKFVDGGEIGFALGLHNALRLSYTQGRAAGNLTNATDVQLWTQTYTAGTYLSTNWKLQNAKISFDYLTWPYPVESRRFRLKTLWQVQYTNIRTAFDAPLLPLVDSNGVPRSSSSS